VLSIARAGCVSDTLDSSGSTAFPSPVKSRDVVYEVVV
jgi:hypothetical protein